VNKLSFKLISWIVPFLLFLAGIVTIVQGGPSLLGIFITLMGAVGIAYSIIISRFRKAAGDRLVVEFKKRGVDVSNLAALEDFFYDKAAKAIALVTRMYLQKQLLQDNELLFTPEAYQRISNGLANLDNPIYANVIKFTNSVANAKFAGLTVESVEEFHMNYLLGKGVTKESYDAKLGVSVAGIYAASVTLPFAEKSITYSVPEGKITDIQNDVLTYTITYITSQAEGTEMHEEVIYFNISDFNNPKVLLIQTEAQINNIFRLGNVAPEDGGKI